MKRILLVLALVMCLPVLAKSVPSYGKMGTEIILKLGYSIPEEVEKGKRAPAFIPIIASHDTENLYLSSRMSIENATVVVKDEWDNVVYEMSTAFLSGEEIALPINIGEGSYTLEITYGTICLCGDFEII